MEELKKFKPPPHHSHHHHERLLDKEAKDIVTSIKEADKVHDSFIAKQEVSAPIQHELKDKGFNVHKEKASMLPLKEVPKAKYYDVIEW